MDTVSLIVGIFVGFILSRIVTIDLSKLPIKMGEKK